MAMLNNQMVNGFNMETSSMGIWKIATSGASILTRTQWFFREPVLFHIGFRRLLSSRYGLIIHDYALS
jgi:hypothetical protein